MTDTADHGPRHVRQARYLGADAALAAASWVVMSETGHGATVLRPVRLVEPSDAS